MQKTAGTWGIYRLNKDIHKDKIRLPLDAFQQFMPSSKTKVVNEQSFESFMGEVYQQIFEIKEQHKKLR